MHNFLKRIFNCKNRICFNNFFIFAACKIQLFNLLKTNIYEKNYDSRLRVHGFRFLKLS